MILVERLLQSEEPVAETKLAARHACLPSVLTSNAGHIVNMLLAQQPVLRSPVAEASVHRGTRSRIWNAVFTGAAGGQVWKSTGLTDRDQALLVARKWEAEARAERAKLGRTARKPILRVRPSEPGTRVGGLTQKEVALLLNLSERAVRQIEIRAIQKLRNHPLLRQVWRQYLAGELEEGRYALTPDEIDALFDLVCTPEERDLIQKLLRLM